MPELYKKYLNEKDFYQTGDFFEGELTVKLKIGAMDKDEAQKYLKNRVILMNKILKRKGFDIIQIIPKGIK